eukprot:TRINITY_DN130_c0_g3_i1.p1 TRINITY_DN130_c0_g3~~TRINITY_DN130_c0_g3_i1.p1  ORF type:complete len:1171 (+),score=382.86 TRINITY_DN130_c0_g3_i1:179-3514(+)
MSGGEEKPKAISPPGPTLPRSSLDPHQSHPYCDCSILTLLFSPNPPKNPKNFRYFFYILEKIRGKMSGGEEKPKAISPLFVNVISRPRAASSSGQKLPVNRRTPPRLLNANVTQTRSGESVTRPVHPFHIKDASNAFTKSSDSLGMWAKSMKETSGKEESEEADENGMESPTSSSFPSKSQKSLKKSRSEDLLNTWERPDAEDLLTKFEEFLDKEKKEKNIKVGSRRSILLVPRRTDSDASDSTDLSAVSEASGGDVEGEESSIFSGIVAPKFTETKLEENDRLLVGIEDSREVILAGVVDELFSNLTSKRFGRIMTSQNTLVAPPFVEEFLYTYRYFTSSSDGTVPPAQEVMHRITALYKENTSPNPTPEQQALEGANQLRIIGVLKTWMDHHFYDFEGDVELYKQLMNLIKIILTTMNEASLTNRVKEWGTYLVKPLLLEKLESAIKKGEDRELAVVTLKELSGIYDGITAPLLYSLLPYSGLDNVKETFSGSAVVNWIVENTGLDRNQSLALASTLMQMKGFEDQKRMLEKFTESHVSYCLVGKSSKERESAEKKKTARIFSFLDLKAGDIVKQLCIMDHEMLRKITPRELSHQAWSKDPENSPNVVKIIERSNEISYWVATEIVACPNLRRRITIVKRFITIAEQLRQNNNFCSSLAIIAGLNLGCVQKMKKTWEEIPKHTMATFDILTEYISSIGNFRKYRRAFKIAQKPAVPYIAVILKDLTFIEDGNQNFRTDGMVNFEKMTMLAKAFAQVQNYQQEEYIYVDSPEVRQALNELAVIRDEKELYKTAQLSENGGQSKEGAGVTLSASHQRILLPFGSKNIKEVLNRYSVLPATRSGEKEKSPKVQEISGKLELKDERRQPSKTIASPPITSPKLTSNSPSPKLTPSNSSSSSPNIAPSPISSPVALKGMKKTLKIVVIGDGAVGKTSLLVAYTSGGFLKSEYIPTIFDNYNMIENHEGAEINLILWDTAGQEEFAAIRTANYVGTNCFILCYSCNNFSSLRNITEKWVPEIKQHCPNAQRILVGTKSDTEGDPNFVSLAEGERSLKASGAVVHMRCSALKAENVKEVFVESMKKTLSHKPGSKKSTLKTSTSSSKKPSVLTKKK